MAPGHSMGKSAGMKRIKKSMASRSSKVDGSAWSACKPQAVGSF